MIATELNLEFLNDTLRGLTKAKKELPCKYFYDEAGARLFEDICDLEEYYPTRTEIGILRRHAPQLARLLGRCALIEFGSGAGIKTRLLLDHLPNVVYVPVDVSGEQLEESARAIERDYRISVHPVCADFTKAIPLSHLPRDLHRVVFFPGSTIGNFTPDQAASLLRRIAALVGPGGGLVLGVDLVKDPRVLHAAYNDARGVTSRFNLNILTRINRELDADFELARFWHSAFFNPTESRIEMHLVSRCRQSVRIADVSVPFDEGESIRTEFSYKYTVYRMAELAAAAGFRLRETWTDDRRNFAELYLERTDPGLANLDLVLGI